MHQNRHISGKTINNLWLRLKLIGLILILPALALTQENPEVLKFRGTIPYKVFTDKKAQYSIHEITYSGADSLFSQAQSEKLISPLHVYWLRLDFHGMDLTLTDSWIIRFPNYDDILLYPYSLQPDNKESFASIKKLRQVRFMPYADFEVTASELWEDRYLYVKLKHTSVRDRLHPPEFLHPEIAEREGYSMISMEDVIRQVPYLLFIGGMLLMILYSLGIFFIHRDRLFLFYAIYLFMLLLYLGIRLPFLFAYLESHLPRYMYLHNELIQILVNISYLWFAAIFLNASRDFPLLDNAIRWAIRLLFVILALVFFVLITGYLAEYEQYIIATERYFMILFALGAYIYIILNYKHKIVLYLVMGSMFFLAGGVLAMVFLNISYMMLGSAIEVFVFSLAMGYRIKQSEQEKKTIENEMDKVRLIALKAQMNPHFIFNSLNSIRAYVITNETKKASDYITKFAKLIRLILHYASKDAILLQSELEALQLYIELEQLRFRDDFGFDLRVDPRIKPNQVWVPPLILQPYVENAIVHGLAPKKDNKVLRVMVIMNQSHLEFVVRDNGVGRNFSKNISKEMNPSHKSMAMELTRRRIELMDTDNVDKPKITITDLTENDKPNGTEVRFTLPLMINHEQY